MKKKIKLTPQYFAEVKNDDLVYSVCSDIYLFFSPIQFYKMRNGQEYLEKRTNYNTVYIDNRKELLVINLETYEHQVVFKGEEDIRSFQIRKDGVIFIVYQTDTIDVLHPTEEGMYERIEELNVGGMQNYRIYLSQCENFIYLR